MLESLRFITAPQSEAVDEDLPLPVIEPPQDTVQCGLTARLSSLHLTLVAANIGGCPEKVSAAGTKTSLLAETFGDVAAKLLIIAQLAYVLNLFPDE